MRDKTKCKDLAIAVGLQSVTTSSFLTFVVYFSVKPARHLHSTLLTSTVDLREKNPESYLCKRWIPIHIALKFRQYENSIISARIC